MTVSSLVRVFVHTRAIYRYMCVVCLDAYFPRNLSLYALSALELNIMFETVQQYRTEGQSSLIDILGSDMIMINNSL